MKPTRGQARRLRAVLSLNDFEPAARKYLPRPLFGYIAGAAEDNRAYRRNATSFEAHALSPRVLVDVSQRHQRIDLFGQTYESPFGIAPMGINAVMAYRGDIAQAAAAQSAGIPMVLSGSSLIPMEEVIRAAPGIWFQAYVPGDVARIDALIDRVAAAGFTTLVVTVDTNVAANRENNVRTGFATPLRPSLRLAYDGAIRPHWLFGTFLRTLLRHGMPHFENSFATRGAPIMSANVLRDFSARDHLDWSHMERIRARWTGNMVIKGILHPQDAVRAKQAGADGIIVSNHGGRQLDGAPSSIRVLPEIVDRVGNKTEVYMDGGVRSGQDVLKALALGAKGTFVGRAMVYGLGAGGEAGVTRALDIIRYEMDVTMALMGERDVRNIGLHNVYSNDLDRRQGY
jgi:L-lactate dehydrogenase (cytochrome)